MRHRLRYLALLAIGLGIGTAAGGSIGTGAVWVGGGLIFVAAVLAAIGSADTTPTVGVPPDNLAREGRRATLSGLGTQVERILRLAEEQAAAHRAQAQREADEIVAAARAEAQAVLDRARAAGPDQITGS